MKNNLYILFLVLLFFPCTDFAQIEKVIVETYYISSAADSTDVDGGKLDNGSITYRVYVDLKAGNKLRKIYGDKNHALKFSSTKPFFNNIDGETYGKDLKKGLYNSGTFGLDSWLTLGQTTAKTPDGKANFGILKTQDKNGTFVGGSNNNGGSASVTGGLLTNTAATIGIPLTSADGMFAMPLPTYTWNTFGIKNFLNGSDSTIFGSLVAKNKFLSYDAFIQNKPGVTGVIADSNQILVAQITTKGELSFELNVEVEQMVDSVPIIFKYVADGDTLLAGEKTNSYLKYPYAPECGCRDFRYMEYSAKYECSDPSRCLHPVVYGCKDSLACNFDPNANFSTPLLCCYPGLCHGRDISIVCPDIRGPYADCSIHPNPAQNAIFLDVTSGIEENITYSVYDYSGTLIVTRDLGSLQRVVNHEIDISGLNNGLYFIKVNAGGEFFYNQFVKD